MGYFLDKCKYNPNIVCQVDTSGNKFKILIVGRGEDLFFQENDRSILCLTDIVEGLLIKNSIREWEESGELIKGTERERLAKLIQKVYKQSFGREISIV